MAAGLWYTIRRYTQLERLTHRLARWEPGKFLCKSQTKREGASFGRVFPPLILQGFPGPPSGHGRGKRPFPFRDRRRANLGKENMKDTDRSGKRVHKAGNPHVRFDERDVALAASDNNCMANDPNGEKTWYEKARESFAGQSDFKSAVGVVWREDFGPHEFYQHYTTLSSLVDKLSGRWWFSRSNSGTLNDKQESLKFGNREISAKTYQTSFVHGAAENVALWSLYTPSDLFAIRVTIPGRALNEWVKSMNGGILHSGDKTSSGWKIQRADLRDIIYAAVDFRDKKKTSRDIPRCNSLYWAEVNCGAKLPNLEEEIKDDCCTGWMKDYEWRHERESRICLRVAKKNGPDGLWCEVSSELIEAMKFTFSPWLPREYEEDVKRIIVNALKVRESRRGAKAREYESRFRRSVVQGAIRLRQSKPACVFESSEDAARHCPIYNWSQRKELNK